MIEVLKISRAAWELLPLFSRLPVGLWKFDGPPPYFWNYHYFRLRLGCRQLQNSVH